MSDDDFISWKPGAASGGSVEPDPGVRPHPEAADPRSGDTVAVPQDRPTSWPADEATPTDALHAAPGTTVDSSPERPRLAKIAMAAVPVLLLGGLAGGYVWNRSQNHTPQTPVVAASPSVTSSVGPAPSPSAPAPVAVPSVTTTAPAPTTPPRPTAPVKPPAAADASHAQMDAFAQADAKFAASKLDGRWVAMLRPRRTARLTVC